ncbi:MAG: hypothetical protein A2X86_13645 [Bdellovibrionales bacterium GWA2_49_15]|nr:MAG: hypothetical protein A2X86_13645 [Bdellovibrionales bacterium GWA2_49_15]HAZ13570.1 hypothetical protein [Bdellovibrionales bacterium]
MKSILVVLVVFLTLNTQAADLTLSENQGRDQINAGTVRSVVLNYLLKESGPTYHLQISSRVENTAFVWKTYWQFPTYADALAIKEKLLAPGRFACQSRPLPTNPDVKEIFQCFL